MNTILFDLDGTLVPFDQSEFISTYFKKLCICAAPYGFESEKLVSTLWKGTEAMILNDGGKNNHDRFWEAFAEFWGADVVKHESVFDDFYQNEFNDTKSIVGDFNGRRELIDMLKAKGYSLILATNPIFPAVAVHSRLDWIGLNSSDFDYITTYENSSFCKPNPKYFLEILQKIGKTPDDCIMIGNNTSDDMAALKAGIECYLVTDNLENEINADINEFRHGSFSEMAAFLNTFPAI